MNNCSPATSTPTPGLNTFLINAMLGEGNGTWSNTGYSFDSGSNISLGYDGTVLDKYIDIPGITLIGGKQVQSHFNSFMDGWNEDNINASTDWDKINTGIGGFGLANGLNTEMLDYAIRSNYKSAQGWGEFNKLRSTQQTWRTTNTLGKTGASYLNGAKLFGKGVFGVTVINSGLSAGSAFYNDDPNKWGVAGKAGLDVTMGYIGFLGPIGFGVSATYFILDASGAFNSWSQSTNR